MGNYPCPRCAADVPPVPFAHSSYDEIIGPNAEGVVTERTQCPTCGERLERTPARNWHLERCHEIAGLVEVR